eukprot:CAMPEP_0183759938 /NCGR_PEP_ID=MMETSP0739-20130205/7409_1 /TAXON_ID=385413 /ORGANISM="Thalassiosira miniscula, Strain CCMP1093" /LENGTH=388 /DNA_ID=CAMNT_0025997805 /DNA_START=228 /DNA_END=1395 /DNA_ORIENTATION=+
MAALPTAAILLLFNGDILGASGLISSFVLKPKSTLLDPTNQWKIFFIIAFFLTSRVYLWIVPDALHDGRTGVDSNMQIASSLGFLLGGFLVGFGTRLGNGCTTGHGICGMARLSLRSFVGVMSFMFTGILFASVLPVSNPHVREMPHEYVFEKYAATTATNAIVSVAVAIVGMFALFGMTRKFSSSAVNTTENEMDEWKNSRRKIIPSIGAAIVFASGLLVSQMTIYSKIFGFLDFSLIPKGSWDPTLVMVMGGGFLVSFLSYQWVDGYSVIRNSNALKCPLGQKDTVGKFSIPTNKIIDSKLVLGEAVFGLGWGMAGLCPGPAMILASCGYPNVLYRWWPMFFVGSFLAEKAKSILASRASGASAEGSVCPAENSENCQSKGDNVRS